MTARGWMAAIVLLAAPPASAERIVVQSTTSTAHSGLYDHVLPRFERATGIDVAVVAVGTGQAIRNARNCDGDVLIVHAEAEEEAFVAAGYGIERHDLMANDFVLIGPAADPAGVAGLPIADAMTRIAEARAVFVSRGDDSGTHRAERRLWARAGVDAAAASGAWYRESGSGMGATLNVAVGMDGYALTDRATWATFANRGDHAIVVQGDPSLFNQYGIVAVSPQVCPDGNADDAATFVEWMLGLDGQAAIGSYVVEGQVLFHPNGQADAMPMRSRPTR
ncbi:substrate-binding domain-containing protein [Jannaschia sp. LMIT008]|uniref:substrate-binding domain-containing protein n=1 Tax=Jannaschia maritima TaxID=3032585 RepID=UPI002810E8CC|nr:substrate-binding domain-containing protein [Jannaschia sp. LMIT008]